MECIPDQDGVAGAGTSLLASFDVLGNGVFRRVHMTVMLMTQSELKTEQNKTLTSSVQPTETAFS